MVLTQDIGSTTGHELSQMLLFHESETDLSNASGFWLKTSPLSLLQAEQELGAEKALVRCCCPPPLPSTMESGPSNQESRKPPMSSVIPTWQRV